jgi:predicted porin
MKKSLLALAILGAFAGAASAQSSVTIYGIVDTGIARIDNGGDSVTQLKSGNNNSSRIGFKGVEDLGNGLKASFVLENGINTDDGSAATASAAFSRLAYVGLEGGFGAVRLGRQNSQIKTALAQIDPFETGGLINAVNFLAGGGIPERVSNQITYTQTDSVTGAVVPGGADNDTDFYTLGATYDFGGFKLHAAYGHQKAEQTTGDDIKVKSGLIGVTVPFGASKIRAEYVRNNDDREDHDSSLWALGYTYSLSKRTTLYATYARTSNDDDSQLAFGSSPVAVAGENASGLAIGIQHNF